MEPTSIIALLSLIVAAAAFGVGRLTAYKKEGKESGTILTKLDDLSANINRLEKQVDKISDRLDNQVANLQRDQNSLRDRLASLEGRVAVLDGGNRSLDKRQEVA